MQDFRDLKVWGKSHQLTLDIYTASAEFPKSELYGLTSQMRRSGVSVGSNIAEGCCRAGGAEFARFLQIAMGSASELEYQILLARDLNFMSREAATRLTTQVTEVKRMLAALIRKVKAGPESHDG